MKTTVACILILTALLVFYTSTHVYNHYFAKYFVVSCSNNRVKIHTGPISLKKALESVKKLKTQHYHQRLSGFPIKKDIYIIKQNYF